jgi:DNA polymerase-3 subunit delta
MDNSFEPDFNIYLFTGKVDTRRDLELEKLVKRNLDDTFADFDLEKIDGNNSSAEAIIKAVMTAPLGSGKKVVIVDRVDRLSIEDQLRLAKLAPKLPSKACLILLSSEDSSTKQKSEGKAKDEETSDSEQEGKLTRRQKGLQPELLSSVRKHGKIHDFSELKKKEIYDLIKSDLDSQKVKIEESALSLMSQILESNPSVLSKEIEKLVTYVGEKRRITKSDVEDVITKSAEDRVFYLIDEIANRRPVEALKYLNETFSVSSRPDDEVPRILALIGRYFRLLYQTRFLKEQGLDICEVDPENVKSLTMQDCNPLTLKDWQKTKMSRQANLFTLYDIKNCLRSVLSCELAIKGIKDSKGSPRLNLEMLVIKLCKTRTKVKR